MIGCANDLSGIIRFQRNSCTVNTHLKIIKEQAVLILGFLFETSQKGVPYVHLNIISLEHHNAKCSTNCTNR